MSNEKFNLASFTGKMKILHLSWMVFFITFLVWFNMAPLKQLIVEDLGLSVDDWKTLLILNVALTIPARVVIGALTDKFGPRIVYSSLLIVCSIPCFAFALATDFTQLAIARFALGFIGAGFVIGIRMVSEWFPPGELGAAEGIYGGWGNFGSAAAAFTLPTLALLLGGDNGWRYAIAITGVLSLIFGVIYYVNVSDTPKGATYFRPKNLGGMEVTSKGDFLFLLVMKTPMYLALALLNWKLSAAGVGWLGDTLCNAIYTSLIALYLFDAYSTFRANASIFKQPVPAIHRYSFKQVAVLNILYFATFGSELAVISMLPAFFAETFTLNMATAGLLAGMYAFMNLMSRPAGGVISDNFGRKKTLLILTAGLAAGYFLLSTINPGWPTWLAVLAVMLCSFFVQSGEGAVFAAVPLIKRRLTGQIAGMTGAYGNVGAVTYLTVYSLVDASTFFMVIGCTAVLGFVALLFMQEPAGTMTEVNEDGTVELIQVT
ncbi:NarK family nitrate/nitrite MFS transporter [Alteromonas pelagimontana]|uniref:Nitrate/nitrite transporter n=1 Tax=Alteromonas pelagimontana TaxID=1858656 RepID=A0A6M4MC04_9ALTE|nr:NarK family nitrate/nitrite MFS transporter [Alteromonas pelagimontana]QJR80338.1 NarK family nitrate/nitrite MFS transporter [Alteromonas pelagimontana]